MLHSPHCILAGVLGLHLARCHIVEELAAWFISTGSQTERSKSMRVEILRSASPIPDEKFSSRKLMRGGGVEDLFS
jgi:hypothetical protein